MSISITNRGGSSITAPVVAAGYNDISVTSYTAGDVVKYINSEFDTNGAYSSSTGLFTVPANQGGLYEVKNYNYRNDVAYNYVGRNGNAELKRITADTASQGSGGSALILCAAGDTLGIYSATTCTFTVGASYNYVSFLKVG